MTMQLFRCLLLALAVVTAGGEAWAKNWNLSEAEEAQKNDPRKEVNLFVYDEFRSLTIYANGVRHDSYAAYKEGKDLFGFYAKGILFFKAEVCEWKSRITNVKTKTGSFDAQCPSGFSVDGKYSYRGGKRGSFGAGKDHLGRSVSYELGAAGSSSIFELRQFYEQLKNAQTIEAKGPESENFIKPAQDFITANSIHDYSDWDNNAVCKRATQNNQWEIREQFLPAVLEAKRRGLNCGVGYTNKLATADTVQSVASNKFSRMDNQYICSIAKNGTGWSTTHLSYVQEARSRGLRCDQSDKIANIKQNYWNNKSDAFVCNLARDRHDSSGATSEAKRRGLSCGVGETTTTQTASSSNSQQSKAPTSAALRAAEQKARELEQQLAALKAQQEQWQQTISSDTQKPIIRITSSSSNGPRGTIGGRVTDNTGVAELRVDGELVQVDGSGNFTGSTYIPEGGKAIIVEAIDFAGLSSSTLVRLDRSVAEAATIAFESLNPLRRKVQRNPEAIALIIGVEEYSETKAKALFAAKDATVFKDYASRKLGVPENRIRTITDIDASGTDITRAVKRFLVRNIKSSESDVYVFFAGHGLASQDGKDMFLLPYDGAPETDLLRDTSIRREKLFSDIAAAKPKSVTVFLDTCYSGKTRSSEYLIASRPTGLKVFKQDIPPGFTVMTAANAEQQANPLEEAGHGMFSYFLMKGMEGDADADNDNQITAGELHAYVRENVQAKSNKNQTPDFEGDAERVLVRFQ